MKKHFYSAAAALFGLAILGQTTDPAAAQNSKRVALVIGQSAYQNAPQLPNPSRDAKLVADKLVAAKFDVIVKTNLGYLDFKRVLQEFQLKADNAEIALIYYAGHGIQVNQQNYYVPIDAKLQNEVSAQDEAVTLDRMVQAIEKASKLKLVILDACRDNPFEQHMKRRVAMRTATRGLGKEEPQSTDTLIAYAAKQGSTAEDGDGQNSPFALALARHLIEPGLDIRFAFGRIRDEVMKATGGRQEPYVAGSIGGDQISLNPTAAPVGTTATGQVDVNAQKQDYELATKVGSKRAYEIFIAQYKAGMYVEFAKEQIKKLDTQTQTASIAPIAPVPAPNKQPTTEEARAWDRIKDKSNKDELRAFITKYPGSVLRLTAERQLEAIEEREAKLREEGERRAQEAARLREADRLAALQREEDQRRAKASTDERAKMDRACRDQEDRLENLKRAGNKPWVRDDLKRLESDLSCEKLRPNVLAALATLETRPEANSPALVRSAQKELARIGCYTGAINGNLAGTKTAYNNYLSRRNKPAQRDLEIDDDIVSALGKERVRVCPLVCGAGQEASGDRCVASKPPAKKEEPKKQQAKKEEPKKQEQRRAEPQQQQQQQQQQRPVQQAQPRPAMGGGMVGVGF